MYIPKHFEENDADRLAGLIDENNFGVLVTVTDGKPFASHLPFLYDRERNVLRAHVARANPQWRQLSGGGEVLAIFGGPHAYISPSWYTAPGVPTWNYVVTHVYGTARALDDPSAVESIVHALTAKHESRNPTPWTPSYDPRMLNAIVGIEIAITKIEGKSKLSQNRSAADRAAVIERLEASADPGDVAVARAMKANERK